MRCFRKRKTKPVFDSPLCPEGRFFAIGDLHGCDSLFVRLLDRIEEVGAPGAQLLLVGDYVDRGDDSAKVLRRLFRMQADAGEEVMICLKGNHDQMLLDFLDNPLDSGLRWLRYGGLQTLASYGLPGVPQTAPEGRWLETRDRLREAIGADIERWLRTLPTRWQTGNVLVCHAGADPMCPPEDQSERSLLWGHPDFESTPRKDGTWVVHGHTITDRPRPQNGRIPVDTGAYATGRLTAALIETGKVQFFST